MNAKRHHLRKAWQPYRQPQKHNANLVTWYIRMDDKRYWIYQVQGCGCAVQCVCSPAMLWSQGD